MPETSGSCSGTVMGGAVGCAEAVSTSGYSPGAPRDSCMPTTSCPLCGDGCAQQLMHVSSAGRITLATPGMHLALAVL